MSAAFAFGGAELVGLAAAETANPRKSLPTATKQVFWRITLFYILALTLVGLLVPYNDPRLLGSTNSGGHSQSPSPFIIAIENSGIDILPSVINAVILIAVVSVGNSAVYTSSRTLAALANLQHAPAILGYVDRRGRPLVTIAIASALGMLAFLADLEQQQAVLDWLMAISGLSTIFTWTSICLCHIRFRRAWAARGRSITEISYTSQVGIIGSYVGLILNAIVIIAQFWVSAFPIGWEDMSSSQAVQNFFLRYMGVPIIFFTYIGHKMYFGTSYVRTSEMDINTGQLDFNLPILMAQEQDEKATWPRWKKLYKLLC